MQASARLDAQVYMEGQVAPDMLGHCSTTQMVHLDEATTSSETESDQGNSQLEHQLAVVVETVVASHLAGSLPRSPSPEFAVYMVNRNSNNKVLHGPESEDLRDAETSRDQPVPDQHGETTLTVSQASVFSVSTVAGSRPLDNASSGLVCPPGSHEGADVSMNHQLETGSHSNSPGQQGSSQGGGRPPGRHAARPLVMDYGQPDDVEEVDEGHLFHVDMAFIHGIIIEQVGHNPPIQQAGTLPSATTDQEMVVLTRPVEAVVDHVTSDVDVTAGVSRQVFREQDTAVGVNHAMEHDTGTNSLVHVPTTASHPSNSNTTDRPAELPVSVSPVDELLGQSQSDTEAAETVSLNVRDQTQSMEDGGRTHASSITGVGTTDPSDTCRGLPAFTNDDTTAESLETISVSGPPDEVRTPTHANTDHPEGVQPFSIVFPGSTQPANWPGGNPDSARSRQEADVSEKPATNSKTDASADSSYDNILDEQEMLASAQNDFIILPARDATSPAMTPAQRTQQDADSLLDQVIKGKCDQTLGPNVVNDKGVEDGHGRLVCSRAEAVSAEESKGDTGDGFNDRYCDISENSCHGDTSCPDWPTLVARSSTASQANTSGHGLAKSSGSEWKTQSPGRVSHPDTHGTHTRTDHCHLGGLSAMVGHVRHQRFHKEQDTVTASVINLTPLTGEHTDKQTEKEACDIPIELHSSQHLPHSDVSGLSIPRTTNSLPARSCPHASGFPSGAGCLGEVCEAMSTSELPETADTTARCGTDNRLGARDGTDVTPSDAAFDHDTEITRATGRHPATRVVELSNQTDATDRYLATNVGESPNQTDATDSYPATNVGESPNQTNATGRHPTTNVGESPNQTDATGRHLATNVGESPKQTDATIDTNRNMSSSPTRWSTSTTDSISPREHVSARTNAIISPRENGSTYNKGMISPRKNGSTYSKGMISPRENGSTYIKGMISPRENVSTYSKGMISPRENVSTYSKGMISPRENVSTYNKGMISTSGRDRSGLGSWPVSHGADSGQGEVSVTPGGTQANVSTSLFGLETLEPLTWSGGTRTSSATPPADTEEDLHDSSTDRTRSPLPACTGSPVSVSSASQQSSGGVVESPDKVFTDKILEAEMEFSTPTQGSGDAGTCSSRTSHISCNCGSDVAMMSADVQGDVEMVCVDVPGNVAMMPGDVTDNVAMMSGDVPDNVAMMSGDVPDNVERGCRVTITESGLTPSGHTSHIDAETCDETCGGQVTSRHTHCCDEVPSAEERCRYINCNVDGGPRAESNTQTTSCGDTSHAGPQVVAESNTQTTSCGDTSHAGPQVVDDNKQRVSDLHTDLPLDQCPDGDLHTDLPLDQCPDGDLHTDLPLDQCPDGDLHTDLPLDQCPDGDLDREYLETTEGADVDTSLGDRCEEVRVSDQGSQRSHRVVRDVFSPWETDDDCRSSDIDSQIGDDEEESDDGTQSNSRASNRGRVSLGSQSAEEVDLHDNDVMTAPGQTWVMHSAGGQGKFARNFIGDLHSIPKCQDQRYGEMNPQGEEAAAAQETINIDLDNDREGTGAALCVQADGSVTVASVVFTCSHRQYELGITKEEMVSTEENLTEHFRESSKKQELATKDDLATADTSSSWSEDKAADCVHQLAHGHSSVTQLQLNGDRVGERDPDSLVQGTHTGSHTRLTTAIDPVWSSAAGNTLETIDKMASLCGLISGEVEVFSARQGTGNPRMTGNDVAQTRSGSIVTGSSSVDLNTELASSGAWQLAPSRRETLELEPSVILPTVGPCQVHTERLARQDQCLTAQVILEATDKWLSRITDICKSPDFLTSTSNSQQLHALAAQCKSEILAISNNPNFPDTEDVPSRASTPGSRRRRGHAFGTGSPKDDYPEMFEMMGMPQNTDTAASQHPLACKSVFTPRPPSSGCRNPFTSLRLRSAKFKPAGTGPTRAATVSAGVQAESLVSSSCHALTPSTSAAVCVESGTTLHQDKAGVSSTNLILHGTSEKTGDVGDSMDNPPSRQDNEEAKDVVGGATFSNDKGSKRVDTGGVTGNSCQKTDLTESGQESRGGKLFKKRFASGQQRHKAQPQDDVRGSSWGRDKSQEGAESRPRSDCRTPYTSAVQTPATTSFECISDETDSGDRTTTPATSTPLVYSRAHTHTGRNGGPRSRPAIQPKHSGPHQATVARKQEVSRSKQAHITATTAKSAATTTKTTHGKCTKLTTVPVLTTTRDLRPNGKQPAGSTPVRGKCPTVAAKNMALAEEETLGPDSVVKHINRGKIEPLKVKATGTTKLCKGTTMQEFERIQQNRHLSEAFARINSSKACVDCHMDSRYLDKHGPSLRRRRERVNYNCLIALENIKFLEMLRYKKSVYGRDGQLQDFKKDYRKMLEMGKHADQWPELGLLDCSLQDKAGSDSARCRLQFSPGHV